MVGFKLACGLRAKDSMLIKVCALVCNLSCSSDGREETVEERSSLRELESPTTRCNPHASRSRLQGFYARPKKEADGSLNLLFWEVGIPGRAGVSAFVASSSGFS